MTESDDFTEPDQERVHNEEPAEGAEQPGEDLPSAPHPDAPSEGESGE